MLLAACGALWAPAIAAGETPATAAPDAGLQPAQATASDTVAVTTTTLPEPAPAAPAQNSSTPQSAEAPQSSDAQQTAPSAQQAPSSQQSDETQPSSDTDQNPGAQQDDNARQDDVSPEAPETSQTADVSQTATANADATQTGTGNGHVAIRVDDPGAGPGIEQGNTADADASTSTAVTITAAPSPAETSGSPEISVQQAPDSTASATQNDVSNLNVSVRVGSPGDDGVVTQANQATATASSTAPAAPAEPGQAAVEPASPTATATAVQQDVSNTNVSVRVFSPGDNGAVTQENAAAATAASDPDPGPETGPSSFQGTDPAVSQDGARNTNVTIRVASSGADAGVSQATTATTTSTNANGTALPSDHPAVTTVVDTNGLNTNVLIDVNGSGLQQPLSGTNGMITVWRWTWTWDGSDTQVPDDVSSWDWLWNSDGSAAALHGTFSLSQEPAALAPAAGTFSWNWTWTRPGEWSWIWAPSFTLDCGCAWVWNWNWDWTAEPSHTDAAAAAAEAPATSEAAVSQTNTVTAIAAASADATLTETVLHDDPLGTQPMFAGQIVTVAQSATATAHAAQQGSRNLLRDVGSASQANRVTVEATALVAADADQKIDQQDEQGTDEAPLGDGQWAGQQADITQTASARASGVQLGVVTTDAEAASDVLASAFSSALVSSRQHVDQTNGPGNGSRSQWAGQQVDTEQIAISTAETVQDGGDQLRRRVARAAATAQAKAIALQLSDQLAAGERDGSQVSRQLIQVLQGASASADTAQPPHPYVGAQGDAYASSEADASGAALTEEISTQLSLDGGVQDATQNAFVVQTADASSQSAGGLAGRATVVNCATVQQSSRQAVGSEAVGPLTGNAEAFCTPPAAASGPADDGASVEEPHADTVDARMDDELPRHGFWHPRTTTIPANHPVSMARLDGDPTRSASVVAAPPTAAGLAPKKLSTQIHEGPAQTPLVGHPRVGEAVGEPAPPSAPGSVRSSGAANPAPSAGGGVADTPSPLHLVPPSDRRRWDVPAVRRSAISSGRYETPG